MINGGVEIAASRALHAPRNDKISRRPPGCAGEKILFCSYLAILYN